MTKQPTNLRFLFPSFLLFAVVLLLGPTAMMGAIDEEQVIDPKGTNVEEDTSDPIGEIFDGRKTSVGMVVTILGYVIILGGLAAIVWYLFKRGVIRKPFTNSDGKLKIAETRMLGNRQFIMVVEYEEQKILLGVGPGKIDYLTNLSSYRGDFPAIDQGASLHKGGEA